MMTLAKLLSPFGNHVGLVLDARPHKQMIGIDAATIVAAVKDASLTDKNARQLQRDPMAKYRLPNLLAAA